MRGPYLRRWVALLPAVLFLTFASAGVAGTLSATASRDNSMWEEDGTLSSGAGVHLFSGNTMSEVARRALVHFGIAGDPPGAVEGVTLVLHCTLSPGINPVPQTFTLHRVTADWGEAGSDAGEPGGIGAPAAVGDATWTDRFFGQGMPWTAAGGDFVAQPSATVTVGVCDPITPLEVEIGSTPEMVADVNSWFADPSGNFGWILIGDEDSAATARRFESRESTEDLRPTLVIDFDFVPTPAMSGRELVVAAVVLMLAATIVLARRRQATR